MICKRTPKASITDDFQVYVVGSDLSLEQHVHISHCYWTSPLPHVCPSNFTMSKNELLIFPPSTSNLIILSDSFSRLTESQCSHQETCKHLQLFPFPHLPRIINMVTRHSQFLFLLNLCTVFQSRWKAGLLHHLSPTPTTRTPMFFHWIQLPHTARVTFTNTS